MLRNAQSSVKLFSFGEVPALILFIEDG